MKGFFLENFQVIPKRNCVKNKLKVKIHRMKKNIKIFNEFSRNPLEKSMDISPGIA